ncbi:unnamed protein product [Lymnaea stagnalis]|uniref:Pseudouridylate synthase RPUSD4, mitochondrial n=1 Tax=Lymnaea stagnalis TaxID=6523 RepID=A0AAV2HYM2_LYMST
MSLNLKVAQGILKPEIFHSYIRACQQMLSINQSSRRRLYSQIPSSQSDVSEESEDFFGIPKNYKLQHIRKNEILSSTLKIKAEGEHSTDSTVNKVDDQDATNEKTNVDSQMKPLSRKARRRLQKNIQGSEVATTFGIMAFDKQAGDKLPLNAEDLTRRAKDVLQSTYLLPSHSSLRLSKKNTPHEQEVSNRPPSQFQSKKDVKLKRSQSPSSTLSEDLNAFDENFSPGGAENFFPGGSVKETFISSISTNITLNKPAHNLFEEQYFGTETTDIPTRAEKITAAPTPNRGESLTCLNDSHNVSLTNLKSSNPNEASSSSHNLFEEQYFGANIGPAEVSSVEAPKFRSEADNSNQNSKPEDGGDFIMDSGFNEVDKQYFIGRSENGNSLQSPSLHEVIKVYAGSTDKVIPMSNPKIVSSKGTSTKIAETKSYSEEIERIPNLHEKAPALAESVEGGLSNTEPTIKSIEVHRSDDFVKKWRGKRRTVPAAQQEEKETQLAYDVAMKIREALKGNVKDSKEKEGVAQFLAAAASATTESEIKDDQDKKYYGQGKKLDSKGFRILDPVVFDLEKMPSADIIRMLKGRILFDHEDFLAIDKPYGLPSISQRNDRVSVCELLPSFAETLPKSFKVSSLHLVQGLDRDVTGAVILAKNPEVAALLRGMYNDSEQIIQRFWAITKGVPSLPTGLIDIPVGEGKVGDIYKMMLRPRYSKEQKILAHTSKAPSKKAVTEYKILSQNLQAALLECTLHTNNIKHQIRLHLASGLNTPILGDHKYSHFDTLAPQRLHKEMLERLKIRQAKVRHLALHLYCKSVVLTNYKGRMIFLTTRPPEHFKNSLNALKLYVQK